MPITNPSLFQTCIPKTAGLVDYFGRNVPEGRDLGQLAFLQFLLSSQNLSGVRRLSDDILGVPGKKRAVRMQFNTPLCVKVCTTPWNCLDPKCEISPAIQFADFEILTQYHVCCDNGEPGAMTYDEAQFVQYCELNDATFMQDRFAEFDMQMLKALDVEMVQLLRTLIPATKEITMPFFKLNTASGFNALTDDWLYWVSETIADEGMDFSNYVLFGGRFIKAIQHKYKIATASTEGYDITKTAGDLPMMYYDRNFDSIFGTNSFVAIPLNALQLVTWNQFTGDKVFRGETAINATKTAPLGNGASLTFDYQWRRDIECPKYTYFPSLYAELIKAIPGSCTNPDADGILVFKDCNVQTLPVC
jgi:hypothetical protein